MTDRQRTRRGRTVTYNPTATEVATHSTGPWLAMITGVNTDGTVDLLVDTPSVAPVAVGALADPLVTQANANANGAVYAQADVVSIEALANANKVALNALVTLVNELRAGQIDTRKVSVPRGSQAGQFDLLATGPQAL